MSIFGINEFGARFPTLLSNVAIVIMMLFFSKKYLNNIKTGMLAVLILFGTISYNSTHIARTGDYDALLSMFLFFGAMFFYIFYKHSINPKLIFTHTHTHRYIYFAGVAFMFALYTKGVAGITLIPGILIFLAIKGKIKLIFNRSLLLSTFIALIGIAIFYFSREAVNPGYLRAVFENEIGGRFFETIELHQHGFSFYFNRLFSKSFKPWNLFLIPALIFLFKHQQTDKELVQYLFLVSFSFLVLIGFSGTKLAHYDAPFYPLISFLLAYVISELISNFQETIRIKNSLKPIIIIMLIGPLLFFPIKKTIKNISKMELSESDRYGLFINQFMEEYDNYKIIHSGYHGGIQFYLKKLKLNNKSIGLKIPSEVLADDTILVCEEKYKKELANKFKIIKINEHKTCELWTVRSLE